MGHALTIVIRDMSGSSDSEGPDPLAGLSTSASRGEEAAAEVSIGKMLAAKKDGSTKRAPRAPPARGPPKRLTASILPHMRRIGAISRVEGRVGATGTAGPEKQAPPHRALLQGPGAPPARGC